MNDFRKLKVWHKAHALVLATYRGTAAFPASERFGLVTQMRRSAVSIPANIAEGCGRRTRPEEAQFLQVAFGSACELEAELSIARDLGYLPEGEGERLHEALVEVQRMLNTLARRTWARAHEAH